MILCGELFPLILCFPILGAGEAVRRQLGSTMEFRMASPGRILPEKSNWDDSPPGPAANQRIIMNKFTDPTIKKGGFCQDVN